MAISGSRALGRPAEPAAKAQSPGGNALASYLADRPPAYALSLAASGGVALYALAAGARPGHRHRVLWLALGAHCAAQLAGIVAATEVARRRASAAKTGD